MERVWFFFLAKVKEQCFRSWNLGIIYVVGMAFLEQIWDVILEWFFGFLVHNQKI